MTRTSLVRHLLNFDFRFGAIFLLALAAPLARSQTRFALAGATAGNEGDAFTVPLVDDYSDTGNPVSITYARDFEGLNGDGNTATMSFSGTAGSSAEYGRLRARASSLLANSLYNVANPKFYDTETNQFIEGGVPDLTGTYGYTGFTDILQYGGELSNGYLARYVFAVDGTNSGFARLSVRIGDNPTESYIAPQGQSDLLYSTQSYPIDGNFRQTIEATLQVGAYEFFRTAPDGSTLSQDVDFSSTAKLAAILLFDANGNPVADYTVTGASGTVYPTSPVPEPASLAALGLGALALFRRRRSAVGVELRCRSKARLSR